MSNTTRQALHDAHLGTLKGRAHDLLELIDQSDLQTDNGNDGQPYTVDDLYEYYLIVAQTADSTLPSAHHVVCEDMDSLVRAYGRLSPGTQKRLWDKALSDRRLDREDFYDDDEDV